MPHCPKGHGVFESATLCPRCGATLVAEPSVLHLASGIDLWLVRVPAGEFLMGSSEADIDSRPNEKPQHTVHLSEYWIGKWPVTVAQWRAFARATGYRGHPAAVAETVAQWQAYLPTAGERANRRIRRQSRDDHPVTFISWGDAVEFCTWASKAARREVSLPSEAQWEKAARGTDARLYPWGNVPPDQYRCNYNGNVKATTPVGSYSPQGDSPYGCSDMAGNVYEWVADWYADDYSQAQVSDPKGPSSGQTRVWRSGGERLGPIRMRVANRRGWDPVGYYGDVGFRVAVSPLGVER